MRIHTVGGEMVNEELLVVEPIVACRLFQLKGPAALCSVSFSSYIWGAGINVADCRAATPQIYSYTLTLGANRSSTPHTAPDFHCTCGLHAFKNVEYLSKGYLINARASFVAYVLGEVELTGRVIEHEYGYRAEKAQIMKLICDKQTIYKATLERIRRAASYYRVPLLNYDDWRERG